MAMLDWSIIFLIIALIANALEFTGIAKILVSVFIVVFFVSLIFGAFRSRRPPA